MHKTQAEHRKLSRPELLAAIPPESLEKNPLFPGFFLRNFPEPILNFPLFIDGQDIDTRHYEYVPFSDQQMANPLLARECLYQIKHHHYPLDTSRYVYARYAWGNLDLSARAIGSAQKAFQQFKNFSIHRRRIQLNRANHYLLQEKEKLVDLWIHEGLSKPVALWQFNNIAALLSSENLDILEQQLLHPDSDTQNKTTVFVRRPFGVTCIAADMNPSDTVQIGSLALFSANTLVIAALKKMPVSTIYLWRQIFARAFLEQGAPAGTINIISENPEHLMLSWMRHPDVQCIFSGGSTAFLKHKTSLAKNKIIVDASTKDAVCIWKDADLEKATDSLLDAFLASGQLLHIPKKVLVHASVYEACMQLLVKKTKALHFGLPQDHKTLFSPAEKIEEFSDVLEDALMHGANVLTGNFRTNPLGQKDAAGPYLAPTIVECPQEKAQQIRCWQQQPLFPLLSVIRISADEPAEKEKDRAIFNAMQKILSDDKTNLQLSVWAINPLYLNRFIEEIHYANSIKFNARHSNFCSIKNDFKTTQDLWGKISYLQSVYLEPSSRAQ